MIKLKTGIFGGSFNPIHNGHIELAKKFYKELGLDRLLIVPSYIPPHKFVDTPVFPDQRFEMCCLAAEGIEGLEVSNIEIKRHGASYTYLTLKELHSLYPDDELYLITGADMFMTLQDWKKPEVIFEISTVCGVSRNNDNTAALEKHAEYLKSLGARTVVLDAEIMTVSSTEIRRRVRNKEDISGLVDSKVKRYIKDHNLYR